MASLELNRFCTEWLRKADQYSDSEVHDCYDKFFTLFVVFNRLYAEATFELARNGQISLPPNRPLPDRKGATEHTLLFIGLANFEAVLQQVAQAVSEIETLLDQERFYIKLSSPNGDRQRDKDLVLLSDLRSSGKRRALAVLDVVYTVRCNMFHGHKAFEPLQVELLQPSIRILLSVTHALQHALGIDAA